MYLPIRPGGYEQPVLPPRLRPRPVPPVPGSLCVQDTNACSSDDRLVLIVTPKKGSVPEPRAQRLITGDRIVFIPDGTTSSALQKAGVKVAEISLAAYNALVATLTPETFEGLGVDGKLIEDVIPTRLSVTAMNDIDIRGVDGKVEETYIPSRLSVASLNALLSGGSATGTTVNHTVTGTSTISTANIGTATVSTLNATTADVVSLESDRQTLVQQSSSPASPGAGLVLAYADGNGRVIFKDPAGIERRVGTKRIVTNWPPDSASYLGDEAINSTTGEHRIYLGATKGWRLASPFVVTSLADRDALANKYPGMRVFCDFGQAQDHVWRSDLAWHGTRTFLLPGVLSTPIPDGINDTNWRTFSKTTLTDPGYGYYLHGQVNIIPTVLGVQGIFDVRSMHHKLDGTDNVTFNMLREETTIKNKQLTAAPISGLITGDREITVVAASRVNRANWSLGNPYGSVNWMVVPA